MTKQLELYADSAQARSGDVAKENFVAAGEYVFDWESQEAYREADKLAIKKRAAEVCKELGKRLDANRKPKQLCLCF